jgi:hypothetical protein
MKKEKSKIKTYENYPGGMVLLAVVFSLLIYALGAYVLFEFNFWVMVLYLVFCFFVELNVLTHSCVNCYYYGKVCCFGKGKICSLFFKKGNNKSFCKKQVSWKDMIPDMLIPIVPILAGIALLIWNFRWDILVALILLVILSSFGNSFIRGNCACKFCKQRALGCPAEQLFNKKIK